MIGRTIGQYQVIDKIGEGGMGAVYSALDSNLNRKVALKILPTEFAGDSERRARFEREAQAVAALNNPHIVTIYSIEDIDDTTFITMELVEGKPLSDLIPGRGMSLSDFFNLCLPIIDAVRVAHQHGITHRDLKPDNIIVDDEGRPRLLDFGLAKLRPEFEGSEQSLLTSTPETVEGMILGTVAYMSPEQAVGGTVDHRTDIFSLGIILHEMLTGERPFQGDTPISVLSSIVKDAAPRVSQIKPELPGHLGRIIKRCLAKQVDRRFQTALDVHNELEELKGEIETGELLLDGSEYSRTQNLTRFIPLLGTAVLIALLLFVPGFFRDRTRLQIVRSTPLTTAPGAETNPTWSPDGARIAYASDETDNWDIWIQQVGTTDKINLTGNHSGYDLRPAWSPDGAWIAYVSESEGVGIYVVSAIGGGDARRIVDLSDQPILDNGMFISIAWSPNGQTLAFTMGRSLQTVAAEGGHPVLIKNHESDFTNHPAWHPDGSRVAYSLMGGAGLTTSSIQVTSIESGNTDGLIISNGPNLAPAWTPDGRFLVFLSDRGGTRDLWYFMADRRGLPQGEAAPLTLGVGIETYAISADGNRLAYSESITTSNIFSSPIQMGQTYSVVNAVQLTDENNLIEHVDITPDGEWIAYDSNLSGNQDIWIMRADGSGRRKLTRNPAHDWAPRWSPDGSEIVFYSIRTGNRDVFVIPASGGTARQLTVDPSDDRFPAWSPDGRTIAFWSERSGNSDIWTISRDGSVLNPITEHPADDWFPIWTPSGDGIVFASNRNDIYQLWITTISETPPATTNPPEPISEYGTHLSIKPCSFSTDGQYLFFMEGYWGGIGTNSMNAIDLDQGTIDVLLTTFGTTQWFGMKQAYSGNKFYFPLFEITGDIQVTELAIVR